MASSDWERAKEIFHRVADLSGPEQERWLRELCGDDEALREEVESLLEASERAGDFMGSPTFEGADLGEIPSEAASGRGGEGPGDHIGPFKLLQQIGEGGFGIVFMAEQEAPIRRRVALKVIKPGMDSKEITARFEAERQALAMLNHPNIASVYDAGTTEAGRPYFVMELVRGVPITDFCDDNRLSMRERLALFRDVCNAIHHAHQTGIIHRDIKPSNVLVTLHDGDPMPKVIDFGVAKATHHRLTDRTLFTDYSRFVGTPAYMSPEQAEIGAVDIDERTDVYSLGVLLYELLTGSTPLDASTLRHAAYLEMLRILREEEPPRPSTRLSTLGSNAGLVARNRSVEVGALAKVLRGDLDWIAMKALDKKRSRRYETAAELAADIDRYFYREPIRARPPSVLYRLRKFADKRRVPLGAAAAITVAFLAAGSFTAWRATAMSARLAEAEALAGTAVPTPRLITDGGEASGAALLDAAVAPDGEHLLRYAPERRAFELLDIDSHQARALVDGGPPPEAGVVTRALLSADEGTVAAIVRTQTGEGGAGSVELRLFGVGGGGPGRVAYTWAGSEYAEGSPRPFGWAADDPRVFLWGMRDDRTADILSVDVEAGHMEVLKTIAWRSLTQPPSLAPDARFVAYHDADEPNGPNDIHVLATDGSHEVRIDHPDDDTRPVFAPDGSGVVFLSDRRDGIRDLWFQPLADGRPAAESRIVVRDVGPFGTTRGFGTNGSLFYYFAQTRWEVYTVPIDTETGSVGAARRVEPRAGEMNESPAFGADPVVLGHLRDRGQRLVLHDLESAAELEVPLGGSMLAPRLALCPVGDVAFVTGFRVGLPEVRRVDVRRGRTEVLPLPEPLRVLCLGDGNDIVYAQGMGEGGRGERIVRRSLGTGAEQILHAGDVDLFGLSQSGEHVAFSERRDGRAHVMVMPSGGGEARSVASAPIMEGFGRSWSSLSGALWEPGGASLLIVRTDADVAAAAGESPEVTLERIVLESGQVSEVGRFRLPAASRGYFGAMHYALSADGSRVAFQRHVGLVAEVWAIDGLLSFIQSGRSAPVEPGGR